MVRAEEVTTKLDRIRAWLDGRSADGLLLASENDVHHQRLAASQVVASNPSVSGAKSEDTVLVTASGPEVLPRTGSWPEEEVALDRGAMGPPSVLLA